ncbi:hypothetical protein [uncultured Veillonella sp.]|uniref:hypothetical protein n=1 Tax=uncultured Veillonella sp. TaxID=159268 RepID=UPI00261F1C2E|nr:hypothetical protein [uncultured Veillonella sp.]
MAEKIQLWKDLTPEEQQEEFVRTAYYLQEVIGMEDEEEINRVVNLMPEMIDRIGPRSIARTDRAYLAGATAMAVAQMLAEDLGYEIVRWEAKDWIKMGQWMEMDYQEEKERLAEHIQDTWNLRGIVQKV